VGLNFAVCGGGDVTIAFGGDAATEPWLPNSQTGTDVKRKLAVRNGGGLFKNEMKVCNTSGRFVQPRARCAYFAIQLRRLL